MKGLVSIIIPIYNAQNYLVRCLESIKNQTYTNLEVLLIDDGSTDESGLIADNYAKSDSRFKVFHTENRGVSAARNLGLNNFTGEYVTFVDADDFILKQYIEKLYNVSIECSVKRVISLPYDSTDGQIDDLLISDTKRVILLPVEEEFDYTKPYAYGTVWGGLVHKSLVEDVRFLPDLYVGEDEFFYSELLKKCKTIAIIEEQLYVYMLYQETASRGIYDEKKKTNIFAWKMIEENFSDYPEVFQSRLKARCCVTYLEELKKMLKSDYKDMEWHALLIKNARRTLKDLIKSSYSKKTKLSAFFYCTLPKLFEKVYVKCLD